MQKGNKKGQNNQNNIQNNERWKEGKLSALIGFLSSCKKGDVK